MDKFQAVGLPLLATGIPGLDAVLGGGVPTFSFNLISGPPGSGKTTLAHQLIFANATPERPALYFTVLGESPLKMLRYQQQLGFFDLDKHARCIHFVDLSSLVLEHGLAAVLEQIALQVRETQPALIVVDSFQAVIRTAASLASDQRDLESFVQRLAIYLAAAQATTFLVGEQLEHNPSHSAVLTIADGIVLLEQHAERNSVVRTLQVLKSRGVAATPGLHTFRITQAGLRVFPRMDLPLPEDARAASPGRIASGTAGLDGLLGGGIPAGDAVLISGPSGAGKSILATQFIVAGIQAGEPGVIAVFEEHPTAYRQRASNFGLDLAQLERDGMLTIIYLRPLDLSPDEALYAIRGAVAASGATRVVIDSLSGFELALATSFRTDFRESLYRLVSTLTGTGITVLLTMEITETAQDLRFSPYVISFLADTILLLRYVEQAGELTTRLLVVKMRNSAHSRGLRLCEVTPQGLIVRDSALPGQGPSIGACCTPLPPSYPGLTTQELVVLQALVELGEVPAALLAQRTGMLNDSELTHALDRLIRLSYAHQVTHEGSSSTYGPIAHMLR